LDSRLKAIKASMTLIRPIKFDDDKSKAPASFLFSLGLWLISSLFISIQLLPPAIRVRLSERLSGAVGARVEMMVIDTMFLRLHFVILLYFYMYIRKDASDRNLILNSRIQTRFRR
jgi:hypothetical protein